MSVHPIGSKPISSKFLSKHVSISRLKHRSILTTVRKKAGKRASWKFRAFKYLYYLGVLLIMICGGAGVFVGLQKIQWSYQYEFCTWMKDGLLNEIFESCTNNSAWSNCTEKKSEFRLRTAECFGLPISEVKPVNSYARAVLYAYSIITTIGYGHVAAQSISGRIWTIFYAILGIPLFFFCVNYKANRFHYYLTYACERMYHYWIVIKAKMTGRLPITGFVDVREQDIRIFVFSLFVFMSYVCLTAGLYAIVQTARFWDAFYFAFQSMALIGFGDVVLVVEDAAFIMVHIIFNTIGIMAMAMVTSSLREWYTDCADSAVVRMAKRFRIDLGSEPQLNVGRQKRDDDTIERVLQAEQIAFDMQHPKSSDGKIRRKTSNKKT